jgi:hypothetical protein
VNTNPFLSATKALAPRCDPRVQWNHVDGPLLRTSTGGLHWLTICERMALWLRLTTVDAIDRERAAMAASTEQVDKA